MNSIATTVKLEEMNLARQVISTFEDPLDLANYKDECRNINPFASTLLIGTFDLVAR